MAGNRSDGSRINYRMSFLNAEGEKIPGPVMQAPEDAVEAAGIELWMVPEREGPFYKRDEEEPGGA